MSLAVLPTCSRPQPPSTSSTHTYRNRNRNRNRNPTDLLLKYFPSRLHADYTSSHTCSSLYFNPLPPRLSSFLTYLYPSLPRSLSIYLSIYLPSALRTTPSHLASLQLHSYKTYTARKSILSLVRSFVRSVVFLSYWDNGFVTLVGMHFFNQTY